MSSEMKRLYRSRDDRMLAGVCGGLGVYLGIDPTIIRILFVLAAIAGVGGGLLVYLVLALVVPEEPLASEAVVDVEEKK